VRELRADFRRYYHVRYEDVCAEEAIDLVLCLPRGSLYLGALDPAWMWSEGRSGIADVCDQLSRLMQLSATGSTEGAPRITRPTDAYDHQQEVERAHAAKRKMETTRWEAIDG
jgi:hypothetical protein